MEWNRSCLAFTASCRGPLLSTLLLQHPSFLDHLTPEGHPERPDRIRAIDRILENERFQVLEREQAPLADLKDIARVHAESYIESLQNLAPKEGLVRVDADTIMSPGTWEAALRAAGAACLAVDEVVEKKVNNAFCAARPPGHHAEKNRAMGFCFFNNAAIAARYAQAVHGIDRVAIVDFDVHHGNGTQDTFWNDPTVMYCSTHQLELYPGSGAPNETGEANTIVNAPLMAGADGKAFQESMETIVLPRLDTFAPELVIISAGFDAHIRDPLGGLNLVEADFAWATHALMEVAHQTAEGRVVSVLEGGYDLESLARSVAAHIMTLMNG